MITIMKDLPSNVLGISAVGKITGKDYETILIPALEQQLKSNKKLRILYHLGSDFTDFELSAMVDDAQMGMKHFSAWEKIALVSDHSLINTLAKFFGYMMHGAVRVFENADLAAAKSWVIEA